MHIIIKVGRGVTLWSILSNLLKILVAVVLLTILPVMAGALTDSSDQLLLAPLPHARTGFWVGFWLMAILEAMWLIAQLTRRYDAFRDRIRDSRSIILDL